MACVGIIVVRIEDMRVSVVGFNAVHAGAVSYIGAVYIKWPDFAGNIAVGFIGVSRRIIHGVVAIMTHATQSVLDGLNKA